MATTLKILLATAAVSVAIWCTIEIGVRVHYWVTAPSAQEIALEKRKDEYRKGMQAAYDDCMSRRRALYGDNLPASAYADCWGAFLASPPPWKR